MYRIGQFAKLTGVTERALRFYDKKGLLKPSIQNGYRYYSDQDLLQLQKILTLKYVNLSLEEIEEILSNKKLGLHELLQHQQQLLLKKRRELDQVIDALNRILLISKDTASISKELLLQMIHNTQYEDEQRQYLSQHLPEELLEAMYLDDADSEQKRKYEQRMTSIINEILDCYNNNLAFDDEQVQAKGQELYGYIEHIYAMAYQKMSAEDRKKIETMSEEELQLDELLFPKFLGGKEDEYVQNVLMLVEEKRLSERNE